MNSCDDCKFGSRNYSDGLIYRNWSGAYAGDVSELPVKPDPSKFWTYVECAKNHKKLKHINLAGDCKAFKSK